MNIPRGYKLVLWISSAIGETITGVKILIDAARSGFWNSLNPWYLMFAIFSGMLIALGVVWCMERLDARFAAVAGEVANVRQDLQNGLAKEAQARGAVQGTARQWDELMETRLTDKLKTIESRLPSAVPEIPAPLKGRVWKLIEDLQGFSAAMGAKPQFSSADQDNPTEIALWGIKLQCGFEMNFSERLKRIYCELGFNGLLPVTYAPRETVQNQEELDEVIDFLRKRVSQIDVKQLGGAA